MAYILIADGIFVGEKGWRRHLVVTLIPVVAIVHECLQYKGLARGDFDIGDLIAYGVPLVGYLIVAAFRAA